MKLKNGTSEICTKINSSPGRANKNNMRDVGNTPKASALKQRRANLAKVQNLHNKMKIGQYSSRTNFKEVTENTKSSNTNL